MARDHYHHVKSLNASEKNIVTNWTCKHKAKLSRRKSLYLNESEMKRIQKMFIKIKKLFNNFFNAMQQQYLIVELETCLGQSSKSLVCLIAINIPFHFYFIMFISFLSFVKHSLKQFEQNTIENIQ